MKKLLAFLKGLGEAWGVLATLGLTLAAVVSFAKSLPGWVIIAFAGAALVAGSSLMTTVYHRRRVFPRFRESAQRWHNLFAIAKQQRDELDAMVNGEAWPPKDSVNVAIEVFDSDYSIVLKGTSDAARAELELYLPSFIASPFPVVLRHYTLDITVSGPGVTASGLYEKPTGWPASSPRTTADFHVRTSLDAKVGVGALQQHAVISVKGYVVVGSEEWETDGTVHFRLSRRCLVRSELPKAAADDSPMFHTEPPRGFG